MQTLLHIDSSPRGSQSHTKKLCKLFRKRWLQKFPNYSLNYRNLNISPPSHVNLQWIDAAFAKGKRTLEQQQALEISNRLVDEFLAANTYLLGIPMYNFGVPSIFKAYIDNIIRVNRTFSFDPKSEDPYTPLVSGKKMFVIVATGDNSYQEGEKLHHMNHLEPHVRTAFGFIGIEDIHFIYCGYEEFGGSRMQESIQKAMGAINRMVNSQPNKEKIKIL